MKRRVVHRLVITLTLIASMSCVWATAQSNRREEFVRKSGTSLTLGGQPFRYSGPNIEWLGLEGYGPADPMGPHYPSHAEVNDVFATAAMMGARVVRSQTMGDTVGCGKCIEPTNGTFNEAGFQGTDYALAVARKYGMKVIITLVGDCATCSAGGIGQYLAWEKKKDMQDFFTDPQVIAAFEKHINAVLNHVNPLTGIAYKNDPTIMAWENCNECGLMSILIGANKQSLQQESKWVETIGKYVKSIDKNHLYLDDSGLFYYYPKVLDDKSVDITTNEYYPHWVKVFDSKQVMTAETFRRDAATVTGHGKVYIVDEYGWDVTDWPTRAEFANVLNTMVQDKNISGDAYWALQAHNTIYGWQPIPANVRNAAYSRRGESGQWWALYWGGINTLINSRKDMQARAEMLRTHAFAMAGIPVPPYPVPPAPVITVKGLGVIAWRGSAGAVNYSVQRQASPTAPWKTICDRCATDTDTPWVDPNRPGLLRVRYRVIAYNADGVASKPSAPR